jgi:hypothetical protein
LHSAVLAQERNSGYDFQFVNGDIGRLVQVSEWSYTLQKLARALTGEPFGKRLFVHMAQNYNFYLKNEMKIRLFNNI